MIQTFTQLVTNPALLSLGAGFAIGVYRLAEIPNWISNVTALYLVFCIGLKGGLCLGAADICSDSLYTLALAGIIIGLLQPFIYYVLLKQIVKLDRQTLITIATQYGSISIVTFLGTTTFLQQQGVAFDNVMPALAGIMEIPALISGLILLKGLHDPNRMLHSIGNILVRIIRSKKISFIFLGFIVGYIMRVYHLSSSAEVILWPFTYMLIIFMVDIGIKIAQQRHYIHTFSWSLIAFGIYIPVVSGLCALLLSYPLGLSIGTATLFSLLVASASYIAVPAVMSSQAPEAKEVIYLPLALGITLPFNLFCGIPLFYNLAVMLLGS